MSTDLSNKRHQDWICTQRDLNPKLLLWKVVSLPTAPVELGYNYSTCRWKPKVYDRSIIEQCVLGSGMLILLRFFARWIWVNPIKFVIEFYHSLWPNPRLYFKTQFANHGDEDENETERVSGRNHYTPYQSVSHPIMSRILSRWQGKDEATDSNFLRMYVLFTYITRTLNNPHQ